MMNAAYAPAENLAADEMHHRMANTFTIIGALLAREAAGAPDRNTADILLKADAQLRAFALAHDMLRLKPGSTPVLCAAAYLAELGRHLDQACLRPRRIAFAAELKPCPMPSDTCQTVGLIAAELVMNAAKHAFTDRPSGVVRIEAADDDRGWEMRVSDDGVGMAVLQATTRKGLHFVHMLAKKLDAALLCETSPAGTTISLTVPPERLFTPGPPGFTN